MWDQARDIPVAANMRSVLASLFVNSTSSSCSLPWSWSFTQPFLLKNLRRLAQTEVLHQNVFVRGVPSPNNPATVFFDGPSQHVDFLHILGAQTIAVPEFILTFQQLEDEVKVVVQTHADEIVTVGDTKQAWVSCRTATGTDRSLRKPCFLNIAEKPGPLVCTPTTSGFICRSSSCIRWEHHMHVLLAARGMVHCLPLLPVHPACRLPREHASHHLNPWCCSEQVLSPCRSGPSSPVPPSLIAPPVLLCHGSCPYQTLPC